MLLSTARMLFPDWAEQELGRFDMGVDTDTVDVSIEQSPSPSVEESDYHVSWQFTYLVKVVRNVRILTDTYAKIKKQKEWGANAGLMSLNPSFLKWREELPSDMVIHFPPDGSAPWLPSHFVGNVNCYYHLSIIMLHRPQLMCSSSFAAGGSWKQHMMLCYLSAKSLCRIQEGLLQSFGVNGLLCMQRGEARHSRIECVDPADLHRHKFRHLLHPHLYHASSGKALFYE